MRLQDKLLTQMTRKGLNGQKLAKLSNVSDSEISRIVTGKSRPGLENAFKLARALGVSLDYLADDALDAEPLPTASPLNPEDREILEAARAIGVGRTVRILENVRIIGYEVGMRRLLDAKPILEIDDEPRSVTAHLPMASQSRVNSA